MSTKTKVHIPRKKIKFFLTPVLIISVIFIIYQLLIFIQLNNDLKAVRKPNLLRGTHEHQQLMYEPNGQGKFVCIHTSETIDFQNVNDDYCDCLDGSDEPGTNACPNGEFYCSNQVTFHKYPKRLSSSRVNDGVCDCCDGSDEWKSRKPSIGPSRELQIVLHRFHPPCPQIC